MPILLVCAVPKMLSPTPLKNEFYIELVAPIWAQISLGIDNVFGLVI